VGLNLETCPRARPATGHFCINTCCSDGNVPYRADGIIELFAQLLQVLLTTGLGGPGFLSLGQSALGSKAKSNKEN
jgi:hypothetical protein